MTTGFSASDSVCSVAGRLCSNLLGFISPMEGVLYCTLLVKAITPMVLLWKQLLKAMNSVAVLSLQYMCVSDIFLKI